MIGLLNAAIWLGAAVFAATGAGWAVSSDEMRQLLSARHYPYFSGAIAGLIASQYWHFHLACGAVAIAHLASESLYFGRVLNKKLLALLLGLVLLGIAQEIVVRPAVKRLHIAAHAVNRAAVERARAGGALGVWRTTSRVFEVLTVVGLGFYLWRIANPPEATRFVSPGKYRG
jgi:hypothetical protein